MPSHAFGPINFWISPVTIMKCFVSIGWMARAEQKAIDEYKVFKEEFFPYLNGQDNEMDIDAFCDDTSRKIDEIDARHQFSTKFVKDFEIRLKNTLHDGYNKRTAIDRAAKHDKLLDTWFGGPYGPVASQAAQHLANWDVTPLRDSLGAHGSFGNAVYGQYVPSLEAVCVQMDVIASKKFPELQFIETLLHEEIHLAIHKNMGENKDRPELDWLNELAAVQTSQHAIKMAAELVGTVSLDTIDDAISLFRSQQKHGELTTEVSKCSTNPTVAWDAWKRIFALPPDVKMNYARDRVITPILYECGWDTRFPFKYGKRYVTVFR